MCGIAGIFGWSDPDSSIGAVRLMTTALTHRGPDDDGYYGDEHVALGVRRLAIQDLKNGHQPMMNHDGTIVSVCNGEIFNYRDLRRWLDKRGHELKTNCDVEILPHLYEECGLEFVNRLQGQFAFALYDSRARTLILARDRFGVCPLVYTQAAGRLAFASEIKALLECPGVERRVSLKGLDQVLCLPSLVSPTTMFEGIQSLRPGHMLIANGSGTAEREYWDMDYPLAAAPAHERGEQDALEELECLLWQSVKDHAQADVPVGMYLSGGLDSSLVAALLHRAAPDIRRSTFGVVFEDADMSEARYQRAMAEAIHAVHHEVAFTEAEVLKRLRQTIWHCECPVSETYNTANNALSCAARSAGIKVVLTGQGADELFAGYIGYRYDQYRAARPRRSNGEHPAEAAIRERMWGDAQAVYDSGYAEQQRLKSRLYSRGLAERLAEFDAFEYPLVRQDRIAGRHPIHQRSYLDLKLRLADHLLTDHGDRMAMAHAVENRHPFLDCRIAEFARTLPVGMKVNGWTEKWILKRLGANVLPPEIVEREKFGWYAHGTPALLCTNNEWIRSLLEPDAIRRKGYFDAAAVSALVEEYSQPGFQLQQPFQRDLLAVVLSFHIFLEVFNLPAVN